MSATAEIKYAPLDFGLVITEHHRIRQPQKKRDAASRVSIGVSQEHPRSFA